VCNAKVKKLLEVLELIKELTKQILENLEINILEEGV